MAAFTGIDDLVHSIGLHIQRPALFYMYNLPFVLLYGLWLSSWFIYGFPDEAAYAGFAVLGFLQVLTILICHWSVHFRCFMTCTRAKSHIDAEVVKVVPTANNGSSELIPLKKYQRDDRIVYYFLFQKIKYIWDEEKKTFRGITFPTNHSFRYYLNSKGFKDNEDVTQAELNYGNNVMDMVIPEFLELFQERATAPFFVFQVFCVGLWCLDEYWYYSIFTLFMLITFECTLVQQQLRNMAEIRNMGNKPYPLLVHRNGKWTEILSSQLVPGDIVSITSSKDENLVPCDLLLLRGTCIVDESMLTGESVPQMKEPIDASDSDRYLNMEVDKKLHILFGGTKVLQSFESTDVKSDHKSEVRKAKDKGCVAYVLQTGFNTSQGKLLRTILFGVKRVTANNFETFAFILFLLIFAIVAATYVWVKGCEDPKRNRYKLFLECTLILTSVVPPELPIELSLAVNTSLLSLSKLYVFCTEPFRIPFAGKIDICCFDKTGTLTKDSLVLEGIAGLSDNKENDITPVGEAPLQSIQVLATCHSLARLNNELLGDPLEKAALTAINWFLTDGNGVLPLRGDTPGFKIFHRHHFSSHLKRMSVVAGYKNAVGAEFFIATVKGAPETLKPMFSVIPDDYDETYMKMSQKGARVLALGYKDLGKTSSQVARELTRADLECNLIFAGFVIFSSPLKSDSKAVVREIIEASHAVSMITGDNPLTACHVAKELSFTTKPVLILKEFDQKWFWVGISDNSDRHSLEDENYRQYIANYDLCITGEGLAYLKDYHSDYFMTILPHIAVFSRVGPKQKELIIITLKELGYFTLMCGDGTNDVGALKHADCGVAIIAIAPERMPKNKEKRKEKLLEKETGRKLAKRTAPGEDRKRKAGKSDSKDPNYVSFDEIWKQLDDQETKVVKLGDASIAAPFTSKLSSIQCICHVIKQGRCTLVTTLQMFKILALHALILAYSQSVLYLDGIKFSDFQATMQGLLLAACFLCISRSKPLKILSKQRPLPNIFNLYTITTVALQFFIHLFCLLYLVQEASSRSPQDPPKNITEPLANLTVSSENATAMANSLTDETEEEKKVFQPNLVNSTVYILSMMFQISTFAINYRGHPYMESLTENRALLNSLLGTSAVVISLVFRLVPDMSEYFQIVDFSSEYRLILVKVLIADFGVSFFVDRVCMRLMGEGVLKINR